VLDWLLRSGVKVRSVIPQGSGLEEIFLAATAGNEPRPGGAPPGEGGPQRTRDERADGGTTAAPPERAAQREPAATRDERERRAA